MGDNQRDSALDGGSEPAPHELEVEIEVERDAGAVWEGLQRLEDFSRVTQGVRRVYRIDERHSLWEAEVGGRQQLWEAEIVESAAPRRLAWRSVSGAVHAGEVELVPSSDDATRVSLRIRYRPRGLLERLGAWLGVLDSQVHADLARYKRWLEQGGHAPSRRGRRRAPRARSPHRADEAPWARGTTA